MAKALRLNDRIRISPVRVIDSNNTQLGIVQTKEALRMARDAGLDLVEVSPNEKPPVCRIMDYGKHLYERKKRLKAAAAAHQVTLKEIRLRPKTGDHDRMIKLNNARGFLKEGHKVQFTMLFRGRERVFKDRAIGIFNGLVAELGDSIKVERPALMEGRRMTMVVTPGKRKPAGGNQKPPAPSAPSPTAAPSSPAISPNQESVPAHSPEKASSS